MQPPRRIGNGVVAVVIVGAVLLIAGVVAVAIMAGTSVRRAQATAPPLVPFIQPALPSLPRPPSRLGTLTIGSCAAPDPNDRPDGYRVVDCAEPDAALVTDRTDAVGADSIQCPSGTDVVLDLTRVSGGVDTGISTGTACLRNMFAFHPGEPGMGGGQLVEGDCILPLAGTGYQHITEISCLSGRTAEVLALLPKGSHCPVGTTDTFEMLIPNSRYGLICTRPGP